MHSLGCCSVWWAIMWTEFAPLNVSLHWWEYCLTTALTKLKCFFFARVQNWGICMISQTTQSHVYTMKNNEQYLWIKGGLMPVFLIIILIAPGPHTRTMYFSRKACSRRGMYFARKLSGMGCQIGILLFRITVCFTLLLASRGIHQCLSLSKWINEGLFTYVTGGIYYVPEREVPRSRGIYNQTYLSFAEPTPFQCVMQSRAAF